MTAAVAAVADLWRAAGLPDDALGWLSLSGEDPVVPSSFRIGTAAQASIAASGLAAAALGRLRGGAPQSVSVDMRHAAAEFASEHFAQIQDAPKPSLWDTIAGLYPTGDGGHVRLHTNFAHHRSGLLALLGCDGGRETVASALRGWTSHGFEDAAAAAGLCVTALRRFEEWDASPQGAVLAGQPVVEISRIGEAPPRGSPTGDRPLSGVRVLELTRIIAGPVCGRTLAAHGADVLHISASHLPTIAMLDPDTMRGKLTARLDLRATDARARLTSLLQGADVMIQGYRPGGIAALGFGPEQAASLSPGIVYV